jgi:hypothetical protein
VENERLLTFEERDQILKLAGIKFHDGSSCEIAKAQDAKSYQAGRQDAAREIFEELKKYDATLRMGTAADGYFHYEYKKLSELLKNLKSHYGVTE